MLVFEANCPHKTYWFEKDCVSISSSLRKYNTLSHMSLACTIMNPIGEKIKGTIAK